MTTALTGDALAPPHPAHRTVLPNGLTLLVRPDRSAPAVAIVTYVKAGYFDEADDVVGIAHVLEHMYFKGTPSRGVGEIARDTKASGGYLNAHTIYDHTSYYTVLPASRFTDGLAIQSDAYTHSLIEAGELAKEIEVIIQEVRRKEDSPPAVATESLYALMYDRHRIRRWRIGRADQLRTFTHDGVDAFYRAFYRPANTILAIVGDVEPDDVLRAVAHQYGSLPGTPVHRTPGPVEGSSTTGARYREWSGDILQTQIVLGWRTQPALHPDTPLLDLAALVLGAGRGSRLYRAVRERRLASTISTYNYTPTELGVFVIHVECPPDRAAEAARATWAEVASIRENGIAGHELVRAQRLLESRWVRRTESMEGQASDLAEWEALGGWELGDQFLARALAATADEVAAAVDRYVDLGTVGVAAYRPTSAPPLAVTAEGLLAPRGVAAPAPLDAIDALQARDGVARRRGARPSLERAEAGVRVYRTAAGVPILVRRKPGAQVTHAGVYVFGGACDEDAAYGGITSLTARTALKGAAGRSAAQLADAIEMLGGSIGASVGSENFGWSISVPTRFTEAALDVLGDVVQRPTVPNEALETERDLALAEHTTLRDDMYRYPVRLATQGAYAGHPYGIGPLGTEASLRAITGDQVRQWHETRTLHGPTVVAIVGDLDPDDVADVASRVFDALRGGQPRHLDPPSWPSAGATVVELRDKSQTAVALAFPSPDRRSDDRVVTELIASVASGLGGRFFDELRDRRSLAYTVNAFAAERMLSGMFVGYIATTPDKEALASAGLLGEFAKLCEAGVTAEELARAQTYAVGTHAISRQSGGVVLAEVIDAWMFGRDLGELDRFESRVRAVTPAAVRRIARAHFDPARVVQGIVRGGNGGQSPPAAAGSVPSARSEAAARRG